MEDSGDSVACCCCIFITSALQAWCFTKSYGSNGCGSCCNRGGRGCCGSCCSSSFDEDKFDEQMKKDMAKTKAEDDGAKTTQPAPSKDMSISTHQSESVK